MSKTHKKSGALARIQRMFPHVTQIKDATKNLPIEVTIPDTKSKAVRNHKECAFAQACKRAHVADTAIIAVKVCYLIKDNVATRYITPETLAREITAFDRNAAFEPGAYELKHPSPTLKLGTHKPTGKPRVATGRKRKLHKTENIREDLRKL